MASVMTAPSPKPRDRRRAGPRWRCSPRRPYRADARASPALDGVPDHTELRAAETGLVMVRGRIGGDGAPFNLGEATVTRAAVRLAVGRDRLLLRARPRPRRRRGSRRCCDALWQSDRHRDAVERRVLAPIARAARGASAPNGASRTAATRVDFFTLVRGEDCRMSRARAGFADPVLRSAVGVPRRDGRDGAAGHASSRSTPALRRRRRCPPAPPRSR